MTPLAHIFAKAALVPLAQREIDDRIGLVDIMQDIHCFECSDVFELAIELLEQWHADKIDVSKLPTQAFLPADKTWIEFKTPMGGRTAMLFTKTMHNLWPVYEVYTAMQSPDGHVISSHYVYRHMIGRNLLEGKQGDSAFSTRLDYTDFETEEHEKQTREWLRAVHAHGLCMLAMINTPKIIGRRQHMPHAGLERRLTTKFGSGKFPVHSWTEIKLHVRNPMVIDDEDHEAHLTGRKALHFCRAHMRIKRGRLEWGVVRAHWRGDPALGIKRSRYKVET